MLLPLCALLAFAPASYAACSSNIPHYTSTRFIDNSDGTVTDTALKLTWMRCELGARWDTAKMRCQFSVNENPRLRVTWQEALKKARDFNLPGFPGQTTPGFVGQTDWRMPNIKELASLMDLSCANGEQNAIDPTAFPDAAADVWSNTPGGFARKYAPNPAAPSVFIYGNTAYVVKFNEGKFTDEVIEDPRASPHHVRLVRFAN